MFDVIVSSRIIVLEMGSIGGLIGLFVVSILFIRTLFSCCDYIKNMKTSIHGKSYWFTVIYLLSSLVTFAIYGFIRSNLITKMSINDFTYTICDFGNIGSLISITINRIFLYLIIIEKIKSLFIKEGIFYLFLYWTMSIVATLNWTIWVVVSQDSAHYQLISDAAGLSIYCISDQTPTFFSMIGQVLLVIVEIFFKAYLLFIFMKGLYVAYYEIQAVNGVDIQFNSDEYKHLKHLYNLNKKYVLILVFMNASTLLYYLGAATILDGNTWICWDIMLNSFCVWLMLDCSRRCWRCCTKIGCCCCCYFRHYIDEYFMRDMDNYDT